ncbi:MAG: hypothetical protein ACPGVO_21985 [Spirulinaceae cyanobacterium]
MSYSNFTLNQLVKDFDLALKEAPDWFADAPPVTPSSILINLLQEQVDLAVQLILKKPALN